MRGEFNDDAHGFLIAVGCREGTHLACLSPDGLSIQRGMRMVRNYVCDDCKADCEHYGMRGSLPRYCMACRGKRRGELSHETEV